MARPRRLGGRGFGVGERRCVNKRRWEWVGQKKVLLLDKVESTEERNRPQVGRRNEPQKNV